MNHNNDDRSYNCLYYRRDEFLFLTVKALKGQIKDLFNSIDADNHEYRGRMAPNGELPIISIITLREDNIEVAGFDKKCKTRSDLSNWGNV